MMANEGHPGIQALKAMIPAASTWYYRLLWVVDSAGSGKSGLLKALAADVSAPYLNVSLTLAEALLPLPRTERIGEVGRQLETRVLAEKADVVVLDNIEVLFLPELRVDVLARFRQLARHRTLLVAWPGRWSAGTLSYADPEHPEYFEDRTVEPVSVFTL